MPPKKLKGTEITRAQGQEITRKVQARWIQIRKLVPVRMGGSTASTRALITTMGV